MSCPGRAAMVAPHPHQTASHSHVHHGPRPGFDEDSDLGFLDSALEIDACFGEPVAASHRHYGPPVDGPVHVSYSAGFKPPHLAHDPVATAAALHEPPDPDDDDDDDLSQFISFPPSPELDMTPSTSTSVPGHDPHPPPVTGPSAAPDSRPAEAYTSTTSETSWSHAHEPPPKTGPLSRDLPPRPPPTPPRSRPRPKPPRMTLRPGTTCFHLAELLDAARSTTAEHVASSAPTPAPAPLRFELFARVAYSCRDDPERTQIFRLRDLFASSSSSSSTTSACPLLPAALRGWHPGGRVDVEARALVARADPAVKCRCVCILRADPRSDLGYSAFVREIREVRWRDIVAAVDYMGRPDLDGPGQSAPV